MKQDKLMSLIKLLQEVVTIIKQTKLVLLWTNIHSKEEILSELNSHIQRLQANNITKLDELQLLFIPTGALQDLSIDSGWGDAFLAISYQVDKLFENK